MNELGPPAAVASAKCTHPDCLNILRHLHQNKTLTPGNYNYCSSGMHGTHSCASPPSIHSAHSDSLYFFVTHCFYEVCGRGNETTENPRTLNLHSTQSSPVQFRSTQAGVVWTDDMTCDDTARTRTRTRTLPRLVHLQRTI